MTSIAIVSLAVVFACVAPGHDPRDFVWVAAVVTFQKIRTRSDLVWVIIAMSDLRPRQTRLVGPGEVDLPGVASAPV